MINRQFRKVIRFVTGSKKSSLQGIKIRLIAFFDNLKKFTYPLIPILAILSFGILVYDAGFNWYYNIDKKLYYAWYSILILLEICLIIFFLLELREERRKRTRIFNIGLIIIAHFGHRIAWQLIHISPTSHEDDFILIKAALYLGAFLIFLTEVSAVLRFIYRRGLNPAFLFIASFFFFIVIGALLLTLPNATTHGIKPIDAWFTAASAVCVTGLTVVDTATSFTHIGKVIILALIQIGGLGIMTFAGLLSYLSAGSVSFRNQLALKDMLSSNQISTVINLIGRVIVVTIFFEIAGAFFIYNTLDDKHFPNELEKVFFSIFHSVSAFCNAGFSTYTNNLYELPVRFNYSLHLIIAVLIILGGIGFPILFNIFSYIKYKTLKPVYEAMGKPFKPRYHIFSATSKIVLVTTMLLLLFGFTTFIIFEWNSSLRQHPMLFGKIVTSIFGAVTPRTAGFNTVDLSAISLPTVMVYLLLMWIGASPGSTGGGIKTTVFAVALLNIKTVVLGKERIETTKIEIVDNTIRRAFAIILLSLLVIGIATLILSYRETEQKLFAIAFEVFSAFGTVGLTLGITPDLTITSKITLSIVMFIGRVGTLTLLFAFVTPARELYYRYPKEEISL
jgi:trk system potassium uptake protein